MGTEDVWSYLLKTLFTTVLNSILFTRERGFFQNTFAKHILKKKKCLGTEALSQALVN